MANRTSLKLNDIVVSQVEDGHHLWVVTALPDDDVSLVYRGDGWSVQYAVAKGARLAQARAATFGTRQTRSRHSSTSRHFGPSGA